MNDAEDGDMKKEVREGESEVSHSLAIDSIQWGQVGIFF